MSSGQILRYGVKEPTPGTQSGALRGSTSWPKAFIKRRAICNQPASKYRRRPLNSTLTRMFRPEPKNRRRATIELAMGCQPKTFFRRRREKTGHPGAHPKNSRRRRLPKIQIRVTCWIGSWPRAILRNQRRHRLQQFEISLSNFYLIQ